MNNISHIEQTIIRRLTGDMTEAEQQAFDAQCASNPALANEFNTMASAWDKTKNAETALKVELNKNNAWDNIAARTVNKQHNHLAPVTPLYKKVLRVAAVLLPFIVLTTLWFVQRDASSNEIIFVATTDSDSISLPDGSTVVLGNGSQLAYSTKNNERHVRLQGIALFKVTHDEQHPFVVNTDEAEVRVLGTTFSVEHWPGEHHIRTRVKEGRVSLSAANCNEILTAGQEATWDNGTLIVENTAVHNFAIDSHNIEFRAASLRQVMNELQTCFHDQIHGVNYNCSPDTVLITTRFKEQSLESIIDELNIHFDKNIVLHNGYLTISD